MGGGCMSACQLGPIPQEGESTCLQVTGPYPFQKMSKRGRRKHAHSNTNQPWHRLSTFSQRTRKLDYGTNNMRYFDNLT